MPRDLFGDVTRPSISIGNRKWYTVPVVTALALSDRLLLIASADPGAGGDAVGVCG